MGAIFGHRIRTRHQIEKHRRAAHGHRPGKDARQTAGRQGQPAGKTLGNDNFAFRFDGLATVTKAGSQKVSFKADDPGWVWFDLNGNNKVDADETSGGGKHRCCRWYDKNLNFPAAGEYRVAFAFEEYGGGQNLEVKVANQRLTLDGFANGEAAGSRGAAQGAHWNAWHGKPARD